jgi:ssDNA-binding Zn-finger/Zn-ribbon topoisomerase 1
MTKIMITCPVTKQPVSTGLQLPKEMFETVNIRETTTKCPACGKVHVWSKKDAFLEEA